MLFSIVLNVWGQGIKRAAAPMAGVPLTAPVVQVVALPAGATVQSAGAGFGSLNFGRISWAQEIHVFGARHKNDRNSFTLSTSIGLRLDCGASDAGRLAAMSASLQESESRYTIFLDGVRLSLAPAVVNSSAVCGSTAEHSLQLDVPVITPAGPLSPRMLFQVALR